MIKSRILIATACITPIVTFSVVHAGSMGPTSEQNLTIIPFTSLEASYTWNQFKNFTINSLVPNEFTNQRWGGRLAFGINYLLSKNFKISNEIGGGYYGNLTQRISEDSFIGKVSFDGYDLLIGGAYSVNKFDLYGKLGFMALNMRGNITQNLAETNPGGFLSGTNSATFNQTQVLPEIKVGSIYNLNDKLGISLAYMHVFGSKFQSTLSQSATSGGIAFNNTTSTRNVTLDSIMLGINYNIIV